MLTQIYDFNKKTNIYRYTHILYINFFFQWFRNTDALVNMFQGVFSSILKMFGLVLIDLSLAIFAGYIITELDVAKIAKFIPLLFLVILLMSILFLGIPEWMRKMMDFYTRYV